MESTINNQGNELRIKLQIPKKFQSEPIISYLTSQYDLKVNILQAILGANGEGDGWFDLLLVGQQEKLDRALVYLSELDIVIWEQKNNSEINT